jgi:hypothetical protein
VTPLLGALAPLGPDRIPALDGEAGANERGFHACSFMLAATMPRGPKLLAASRGSNNSVAKSV